MRSYAIPDIHGHPDELRRVHALIARDRVRSGWDDAPVIHLGDLVDRGPDSAGVIDFLLRGPVSGPRWITIRGNHDFMFRLFLADPLLHDPGLSSRHMWLDAPLGGRRTLSSYGVDTDEGRPIADIHAEATAKVPEAHLAFIDSLPLVHSTGPAVFVHAGLRPGVPLVAQSPQDLMWIRKGWLDAGPETMVGAPLVIHGHTVVDAPEHHGFRIALDCGAGYGDPLVAAAVEGRDVWLLTEDGRVPLMPTAT